MRFANPEALALLALVPVVIALWVWRRRRTAVVLPSTAAMGVLPRSARVAWHPMLLVLRCLVVVFLVVALARPQVGARPNPAATNAVDLFIVLDVSSSMASADFQPLNRLDVARDVIARFIDARQGDRLGLITFARYSTLKCPLTIDHELLKFQLAGVDMARGDDDGTAIGMALASAVNHMRKSPAKSRAVILLTDGENNRSTIEPTTGAELARAMGITVYAIGVGRRSSDEGAGAQSAGGQPEHGFSEDALSGLANATGGKYFRATGSGTLDEVFQTIDQLERSPVPVPPPGRVSEWFWLAALVAAALASVELLMRTTLLRRLP